MEHFENSRGQVVDVTALKHDDHANEATSEYSTKHSASKTFRYEDYVDPSSPVEEESKIFDPFQTNATHLLDSKPKIASNQSSPKELDDGESMYSRTGPLLLGIGKHNNDDHKSVTAKEALVDQDKGISEMKVIKEQVMIKENEKSLFERVHDGWTKRQIIDLLYWTDVRKSGIFFAVGFLILICLALFPLLSVLAYVGLIATVIGITVRLGSFVLGYFKKDISSSESGLLGDSFGETYIESYLSNLNVPLEDSNILSTISQLITKWNKFIQEVRKIFLAKDIVQSLKFAVGLWLLTYVSGAISLAGLMLIAYVGGFTVPKFYQVYEKPLDHYYKIATSKLREICTVINRKCEKIKGKQTSDKHD